ncbi:MAG: ABC transporter permease [Burkholderiales bacterium]|nr:ABC transporter permease [Burkholderiales bacterium]
MLNIAADLRLAVRNLLRNTRRSAVAVLTVGAGIAAYLLAGGFVAYIFQEMREATIHSHLGHIQIVRPGYFDKGIADPFAHLLPKDDSRQQRIEAAVAPLAIAPRLAFSGLISRGETTMSFLGEGIDPVKEAPVGSRIVMMAGRELAETDRTSVILGEGLAKALEAKLGDTVVLLVTKENGGPNAAEFGVAGIFATSSKEYDDYALRLPIADARQLMRVDGATSWVILLARTEDTDAALDRLKRTLPANEFEMVPWTDLADFYNKTVVLFSKQVEVVKFIIGLIIVLTIVNIQMMSVLERTTEIGTSLAIGLKGTEVLKGFVIEGAIIGCVGGLLGVAMGFAFGWLISAIGIPMPPPPGMAHGYLGKILMTPDIVANGLLLALLTTTVASLLPAWRASRMRIVDALGYSQ